MASVESFRSMVVARAGGSCEYCRLLEYATGVTFHIEHVLPLSSGGITALSNLALSCPGCNLSKADRTSGADDSGAVHSLFNPRSYHPPLLGWYLHFSLDHNSGIIVPRTPVGIATVRVLNMNAEQRSFARKLQIEAGLIA